MSSVYDLTVPLCKIRIIDANGSHAIYHEIREEKLQLNANFNSHRQD